MLTTKKVTGKEEGVSAYTAVECVALLSIISKILNAFNASESLPQREAVHKRIGTEFYQSGSAWQSGAFHGYFVDPYNAFKLGTRNLSVLDNEKKCPMYIRKGTMHLTSMWRYSIVY
jgi:hypothetical protein